MHIDLIWHTTNPISSNSHCDSSISSVWPVTCYCSEREQTEVLSRRYT